MRAWKRPCLVKGPLGIVSWTELAFLVMFIVLLIWSFVNYIYRGLDKINRVKPDDVNRYVKNMSYNNFYTLVDHRVDACYLIFHSDH